MLGHHLTRPPNWLVPLAAAAFVVIVHLVCLEAVDAATTTPATNVHPPTNFSADRFPVIAATCPSPVDTNSRCLTGPVDPTYVIVQPLPGPCPVRALPGPWRRPPRP